MSALQRGDPDRLDHEAADLRARANRLEASTNLLQAAQT